VSSRQRHVVTWFCDAEGCTNRTDVAAVAPGESPLPTLAPPPAWFVVEHRGVRRAFCAWTCLRKTVAVA